MVGSSDLVRTACSSNHLTLIEPAMTPCPIASNLSSRVSKERGEAETDVNSAHVRKDMFHRLFQARDHLTGGPGYTIACLFEESGLLKAAGSDPTLMTLNPAIFFRIGLTPETWGKPASKMRKTCKNLDEIHAGPQLTCLSSCRWRSNSEGSGWWQYSRRSMPAKRYHYSGVL